MATVAPSTDPNGVSSSAVKFTVRLATFSASYTTGGEAITAASCGLATLFAVLPMITTPAAGAVTEVSYNRATGKLQAFTATAEVANATNLSALTCDLVCIGTF